MFTIGKSTCRKQISGFLGLVGVGRRGVGEKWKMTAKGYGVSFYNDENVPKLIVIMVAQL